MHVFPLTKVNAVLQHVTDLFYFTLSYNITEGGGVKDTLAPFYIHDYMINILTSD